MIVNNVHAMMHVSRRLACSSAGGGSYWYRMIAVAWWLWLALLCRTKAPRVGAGEGCAGGVCFQSDATAGWGGVRSQGEDLRAGAGGERVSLGRACRRRGSTVRRVGWGRGHRARCGAGVQPALDVGPCRAGRTMRHARLVWDIIKRSNDQPGSIRRSSPPLRACGDYNPADAQHSVPRHATGMHQRLIPALTPALRPGVERN